MVTLFVLAIALNVALLAVNVGLYAKRLQYSAPVQHGQNPQSVSAEYTAVNYRGDVVRARNNGMWTQHFINGQWSAIIEDPLHTQFGVPRPSPAFYRWVEDELGLESGIVGTGPLGSGQFVLNIYNRKDHKWVKVRSSNMAAAEAKLRELVALNAWGLEAVDVP